MNRNLGKNHDYKFLAGKSCSKKLCTLIITHGICWMPDLLLVAMLYDRPPNCVASKRMASNTWTHQATRRVLTSACEEVKRIGRPLILGFWYHHGYTWASEINPQCRVHIVLYQEELEHIWASCQEQEREAVRGKKKQPHSKRFLALVVSILTGAKA